MDILYTNSNIDISKYNENISKNNFSNYLVIIDYNYSKSSGVDLVGRLYGLEKKSNNNTYNGYNY